MKGLSDVQGSEALHEVLRTVLAMGNYMNGGKRNGQALGFKLESLSRLSSTKGTDGQTTLMMHLYEHCKKEQSAGIHLAEELEGISAAMRIDLKELQSEINKIDNKLTKIEKLPATFDEFKKEKKENGNGGGDGNVNGAGDHKENEDDIKEDRFVSAMRKWRENEALKMMHSLKEDVDKMKQLAKSLAATFDFNLGGGDEGVTSFLKVFDDFVKEWQSAKNKVARLEEKERREERKRKKIKKTKKNLQRNLKRQPTKADLESKGIYKSDETVQREKTNKKATTETVEALVKEKSEIQSLFPDALLDDDPISYFDAGRDLEDLDPDAIAANGAEIVMFPTTKVGGTRKITISDPLPQGDEENNSAPLPQVEDDDVDPDDIIAAIEAESVFPFPTTKVQRLCSAPVFSGHRGNVGHERSPTRSPTHYGVGIFLDRPTGRKEKISKERRIMEIRAMLKRIKMERRAGMANTAGGYGVDHEKDPL